MKPKAVIDSSPLINLIHLGLASKLSVYFDVIYVPREVHREVSRKKTSRRVLEKLYRGSPFERCNVGNQSNVELLCIDMDPGEAEALTQAQELGAPVFIGDEKLARRIGERMGINPIGTARILARMYIEALADEPRRLIRKLRTDLQYRIAERLIEEAIEKASEPFGLIRRR